MERYLPVFQEHNLKQYNSRLAENGGSGYTVKGDVTRLSNLEQMAEFMFLGLRMMEGVSMQEFADSFEKDINEIYGSALQKWLQMGMMAQEGDIIMLTDAGIDVSNTVLSDFV